MQMNLRPEVKQTFILIGDATVHLHLVDQTIYRVRNFVAGDKHRTVSALYISTPSSRSHGENIPIAFFRAVADAGNGTYTSHTGSMIESVLLSVLTPSPAADPPGSVQLGHHAKGWSADKASTIGQSGRSPPSHLDEMVANVFSRRRRSAIFALTSARCRRVRSRTSPQLYPPSTRPRSARTSVPEKPSSRLRRMKHRRRTWASRKTRWPPAVRGALGSSPSRS